ncbi:MAG: hypothetical protein RLZZ385_411 [Pseudomonadota bacterium]|jgi:peroxiredoxin
MFTYSRRIATLFIALVLPLSAQAVPERVGDFALLDSTGEFHQLSRYLHRKAVVMMSYAADCQSMDDMVARLRDVQSRFEDQGVTFLLLDSLDTPRPEMAGHELGLPVLEDDGQLVSETLDITRAGEVLVLEPLRLSLFYRGSVASGELGQVLQQALNGPVADTVKTDLSGCEIAYPVRDQHAAKVPDYATEVAPIIIEKCAECHREGGAGPFAIDSHIMLMGWSPMIREVVMNRRMPPTQVDPYVSHTKNARFVTPEQMQTLVHWIDAGGPPSASGEDPLADLEFPDQSAWILGEPDFIVEVPDTTIAAVGIMDYVYQDVALPFTEDKWIKALQYVAGDPSVLHHLVTYVTAPDEDFWGPERTETSATRSFLESFAPGRPVATEYPAGTGVRIPAGHQLSMQFHYVTNGRATIDRTRIGLYFHDEPPAHERQTQVVGARFTIPPRDPNYAMHTQHVFDTDVVITGLRARMHYRGKKMKFAVENPDGSLQEILSVPAYNYGWQPHYQLSEPVLVPAGVRVHVIGAFDNSESNPLNPDPEKEVPFGVESWDEMFTGYFTYHTMTDNRAN